MPPFAPHAARHWVNPVRGRSFRRLPNLTILQRGAKLFNATWIGSSYWAIGSDGLTPAAVRFMQKQHRLDLRGNYRDERRFGPND
jgi:hypothetical protein